MAENRSRVAEKAKELGYGPVVVLGHPEYYPKFGFKKASEWNVKAPFEVPEEVMIMELIENALRGVEGINTIFECFC